MKLHEDREVFSTAVSSVAQSLNLPEVYIEKDYWVTWSLKNLSVSSICNEIVFKGGTSLSKAYNLIQRFSEDIDLAAMAQGFNDAERKKLIKSVEKVASQGLEPIPGDDRGSKGSKFRKTVYRYPRNIDGENFGQVSPELLLEVNAFTRPEPYESIKIQSMVAEMMINAGREDLVEQYERLRCSDHRIEIGAPDSNIPVSN